MSVIVAKGQVGKSSPLELQNVNCQTTNLELDLVYVSAINEVSAANATSISTAKCIGFIRKKINSTKCNIITGGILDGFTSLIPGTVYFQDGINGKITNNPPTGVGKVVVTVGKALTSTKLNIEISNRYIIRG